MDLVPRVSFALPDRPAEQQASAYPPSQDNAKIFLIDILAAIHRNLKLALSVAGVVALAVLAVTFFTTPQYKSAATVMLDTRHEQLVNLQKVVSNLPSDTVIVDSEVQVLQSPALARQVIRKLNLEQDPEFNGALRPQGLLTQFKETVKLWLKSAFQFFSGVPQEEIDLQRQAERRDESIAQTFLSKLSVKRQGLTYVMTVTFWSEDPSKAVRIANAVAETYVGQQKTMKADATREATTLLARHVEELRHQVRSAEQAVAKYKAEHGLLNAVGAPLTEGEISALNAQMAIAQAQQAEQEGKLTSALGQFAKGGTEAVSGDMGSDTIRDLRVQRAALQQQEANFSKRYGLKHPALTKVRQERMALDDIIAAEATRILNTQRTATAAARQRTASLEKSIARGRATLATNNAAAVHLGELDRDAQAVRQVYESFLNRLKQTSAQEDLQNADSHIVAPATIPLSPSSPSWLLALAAASVFGGIAGAGAIMGREFLDRGVKSRAEAENAVGLPVLAAIPQIADPNPAAYVVKSPMSAYAEAIRNLRTALFLSRNGSSPKVVAMMSALPHEGKTTTTLALARQCAQSGARVIVVDADLRRHALSSYVNGPVRRGFVEFLQGEASLESCLYRDTLSDAMILPVVSADVAGKDVFFANDLGRVFNLLRKEFDIILVDTAPLLPIAEPRVVAAHADAAVLITHWHKTSPSAMQDAARLMRMADIPIAGLALSCVDMKLFDSFGYTPRAHGQRSAYASYYINS